MRPAHSSSPAPFSSRQTFTCTRPVLPPRLGPSPFVPRPSPFVPRPSPFVPRPSLFVPQPSQDPIDISALFMEMDTECAGHLTPETFRASYSAFTALADAGREVNRRLAPNVGEDGSSLADSPWRADTLPPSAV
eukprot:7380665-Prymnesium_polylepis.1